MVAPKHGVESVHGACHRALAAGVRVGMALAHARALIDAGPASSADEGDGSFHHDTHGAHDVAWRRSRRDDDVALAWRVARGARGTSAAGGGVIDRARGLLVVAHDPAFERRALERIARRLRRVAPLVAIDPPDGVLLDIGGCERLHGDETDLLRRIFAGFETLGVHARVAAAPTVGAAWGLARFGRPSHALVRDASGRRARPVFAIERDDPRAIAAVLDGLPLEALRLDDDAVAALHAVQVRTIGQMRALSRRSLARRLGDAPLRRLDEAFGTVAEPIDALREPDPIALERLFDGPTTHAESIECATWELVDDLVDRLGDREQGARSLELILDRVDADPVRLDVHLGRPGRDPRHLRTLLRPLLADANLGFGVDGVRLRVRSGDVLPHAQTTARELGGEEAALADGTGAADRDGARRRRTVAADGSIGELLDRVAVRFGRRSVRRPLPGTASDPLAVETIDAIGASDLHDLLGHERAGDEIDASVAPSRPTRRIASRPVTLHWGEVRVGARSMPEAVELSERMDGRATRLRAWSQPEHLARPWWIDDATDGVDRIGASAFVAHRAALEDGRVFWIARRACDAERAATWRVIGAWS